MKRLISIVIPAHQSEEYIERCVQSALNQTYRYLEVIAVENGSTDRTLDVLRSIKDPRLVLLQSEKGVSNARNMGIYSTHGEFLMFLDADDWLEENAVETLLSVVDEDVDIVSARYTGDKLFEDYEYKRYDAGSEEYFIKCLNAPTKRGNCTGNMYRTSFIKNNCIFFDPDLTHAEDSVFFTNLLTHNPVVIDLEKPIYNVYRNPASATRRTDSDNTDAFCESVKKIYGLLVNCNENIKNAGYIFALNQMLVIFVNSNKSFIELICLIRRTFEKSVFSEAIVKSDVSMISGIMRFIYLLIKNKKHILLAIAVRFRKRVNSFRSKRELNLG